MDSQNNADTTSIQSVVPHPRVNLWFDADAVNHPQAAVSLWKPIGFLPPVGMTLVPFDSAKGWEWDHDDVVVEDRTWFVERSLIVVRCGLMRPEGFEVDDVFWDAMAAAGWFHETIESSQWD
jgi:hypothetical protein